jgi:hypothetical protein
MSFVVQGSWFKGVQDEYIPFEQILHVIVVMTCDI